MANCFCFQISGLTLLLNFFSVHQMTPLHLAAEQGRSHVVKFLTEKGANVDIKNIKGVGIIGTCSPGHTWALLPKLF